MNTNQLLEQISQLVARDMSPEWRAARIVGLIAGEIGDTAGTGGGMYLPDSEALDTIWSLFDIDDELRPHFTTCNACGLMNIAIADDMAPDLCETCGPDDDDDVIDGPSNTYNVEMLIGDVYRVTVTAPDIATAVDIATGVDVSDEMEQITYDVTIVDSDRRVTHVAVTGGAGK